MPGAVIMVVILLLMPAVIAMSGAVAAGILGHFLKDDVDSGFEGSEFLDLGR